MTPTSVFLKRTYRVTPGSSIFGAKMVGYPVCSITIQYLPYTILCYTILYPTHSPKTSGFQELNVQCVNAWEGEETSLHCTGCFKFPVIFEKPISQLLVDQYSKLMSYLFRNASQFYHLNFIVMLLATTVLKIEPQTAEMWAFQENTRHLEHPVESGLSCDVSMRMEIDILL